jgi:hypothetical protein
MATKKEPDVWRPAARWFKNLFGMVVTILFTASVALWIYSWRGKDHVAAFTVADRLQVVGSYKKTLGVGFTSIDMGGRFFDCTAPSAEEMDGLRKAVEENPAKSLQRWGFAYFAGAGKDANSFGITHAKYVAVFAPMWFVAGVTGLFSFAWMRGAWRRWRWGRTGRCPNCGYDLRSSSGRCPECGMAIVR